MTDIDKVAKDKKKTNQKVKYNVSCLFPNEKIRDMVMAKATKMGLR